MVSELHPPVTVFSAFPFQLLEYEQVSSVSWTSTFHSILFHQIQKVVYSCKRSPIVWNTLTRAAGFISVAEVSHSYSYNRLFVVPNSLPQHRVYLNLTC